MDEKPAKKAGIGRIRKSVKSALLSETSSRADNKPPPLAATSATSKVANKPTSKVASKIISKPTSKIISKPASKPTSKIASKVTRASLPRADVQAAEKDGSLRASAVQSKTPSPKLEPSSLDSSSSVAARVFSKIGKDSGRGYWQGQMLLASPAIGDSRFERSIVYLCHQGKDGALGLVVNKVAEKIQFTDVLDHLSIPFTSDFESISVHVGGPVESSRGFVLHSPEKKFSGTIELGELAMTASADILKHIAAGKGPKDYVFLLGYAGWGTGQLDKEIASNAWLHLPFDSGLIFDEDNKDKWSRAMEQLGISPHLLSGVSGNA